MMLTSPQRLESYAGPTIFLAGAITGAPDWQPRAAELLQPDFATCFNPRKIGGFTKPNEPNYLEDYAAQVDWEHSHLLAADVVLFWMPREAPAITTRFELGWWFGKYLYNASQKTRMAVGIERGVKGDNYYRIVLPKHGIPVYTSLEETCQAAKNLLKAVS